MAWPFAVLLFSSSACVVQSPRMPPLTENHLLSPTTLFDRPISTEPISVQDAVDIDEDMRAFVEKTINGARDPKIRLRRLLAGMEEVGLFSLKYTDTTTRTVRESFRGQQGNCLSFTMLFVALAREAGLKVNYQMVDIPPVWSSVSDLVVLNNHINVVIKTSFQGDYVVDFNTQEYNGDYATREVSDDYVFALYYSNLGTEALIDQDYETSFAYLRESLRLAPEIPGSWANLGLLYSRRGRYEQAESAYLKALQENPRDGSTLTNLVALYTIVGNETLAETYRKEIGRYQRRNPYYHYTLAQQAYREHRLNDALELLARAIRLKHDEHQFHFLQGLVYLDLGQKVDARYSFIEARENASGDEIKHAYEAKIETLASR